MKKWKVAAYLRISRKEKEVNSIANQVDLINMLYLNKDGSIKIEFKRK